MEKVSAQELVAIFVLKITAATVASEATGRVVALRKSKLLKELHRDEFFHLSYGTTTSSLPNGICQFQFGKQPSHL